MRVRPGSQAPSARAERASMASPACGSHQTHQRRHPGIAPANSTPGNACAFQKLPEAVAQEGLTS